MLNPQAFALVNRVAPLLPLPLVGSVLYDGQKEKRECTIKAFEAFEECMGLARPTSILEIGTHAGGSSLLMLALTKASIVSVDIGETWITATHSFSDWGKPSATEGGLGQVYKVLSEQFPNRFSLYVGDSTFDKTISAMTLCNIECPFDLGFVDGNHAYDYVKKDIETCLGLGIKTFILDDYNGDAAEASDSKRAAKDCGLTVVKEWQRVHSSGVGFALLRAS